MRKRRVSSFDYYAAKRKQRKQELEQKAKIKDLIEGYKKMYTAEVRSLSIYPDIIRFLRKKFPTIEVDYENISLTFAPSFKMNQDFPGVGGFFFPDTNELVINKNSLVEKNSRFKRLLESHLEDDDVVLHEMLHFVSRKRGNMTSSREYEEEFAYTNTIPYLRAKGYSDQQIVDNYLIAYCVQQVMPQILKEQGQPNLGGHKLKVFTSKNKNLIYDKAADFGFRMIRGYDIRNENVQENRSKNEYIERAASLEL